MLIGVKPGVSINGNGNVLSFRLGSKCFLNRRRGDTEENTNARVSVINYLLWSMLEISNIGLVAACVA